MHPPSLHSNFFSTLKQVEKRLKLEDPSQPFTSSSPSIYPQRETNSTTTESLGSPIYLNFDQPNIITNPNPNPNPNNNNNNSSSLQESEPPREFLSNSPDFPPTHEDPPPPNTQKHPQAIKRVEIDGVDEIGLLIKLLGLSDCEEGEEQNRVGLGLKNCGGTCGHECGFYAKIVGVKGPKCGKEVERMEGWIKHFLKDCGEGKREPLRLAHLLLAKAAFLCEDSGGFGGFEFPSTMEEFLQNDPPED